MRYEKLPMLNLGKLGEKDELPNIEDIDNQQVYLSVSSPNSRRSQKRKIEFEPIDMV